MGSRFEISAIHENKRTAKAAVMAAVSEIDRIENLISSWKSTSQTSEINAQAGVKAVDVDQELFQLIKRSIKVSELTGGAFDITFAGLGDLWKFDGSMKSIPDTSEIEAKIELVDYRHIELNGDKASVFLKNKGMRIGFGAIGKGYAANRAKMVMKEHDIQNGLVNAGGDLVAWGLNSEGENWKIGIADPQDHQKSIVWLEISEMSVVTSGNYEKFIELDGTRYAHIIDPRTGFPVSGIKSVSVISPNAEVSDALATSIFVLGTKKGIELVNKLKNIECLIIDDENKFIQSNGLNLNFY